MKLYGYQNKDGEIEQAEVEVEEKVVLVPKGQSSIPLVYEKQIDRDDIEKIIGYYPTIFLRIPNFSHAKTKLLERVEKELKEKEDALKSYQDSIEDVKRKLEALKQATNEPSQDNEESEVKS